MLMVGALCGLWRIRFCLQIVADQRKTKFDTHGSGIAERLDVNVLEFAIIVICLSFKEVEDFALELIFCY